jgi:PhnB protein
MIKINPYLTFAGDTEEAFTFYRSVFGGEFSSLSRFKDTPQTDDLTEREKNQIMHVALPLGNGSVLMANDVLESRGHRLSVGNNVTLSAEAGSKAEADKFFGGLSTGGKVTVPLADMFWGAYFGMVTDKFGIHWMVSCPSNPPKP